MSQATQNIGLMTLILEGDWISRGVMGLLVLLSLVSWAVIFSKNRGLNLMNLQDRSFLSHLSRPLHLDDLEKAVEDKTLGGFKDLTLEGMNFYRQYMERIRKEPAPKEGPTKELAPSASRNQPVADRIRHTQFLERLERAFEAKLAVEEAAQNRGLVLLATLASAAPFIGLLGTVLGVIDSLYALGQSGADHLQAIAPGIAAALVATALGLFVAIPALVAFNLLKSKSRFRSESLRTYGLELIGCFDQEAP